MIRMQVPVLGMAVEKLDAGVLNCHMCPRISLRMKKLGYEPGYGLFLYVVTVDTGMETSMDKGADDYWHIFSILYSNSKCNKYVIRETMES
jgi:hypothetical protein